MKVRNIIMCSRRPTTTIFTELSANLQTDAAIVCSDGCIPVHRVILAAMVPLLKRLLEDGIGDLIMLPDFKKSVVENWLSLIYTGTLMLDVGDVVGFEDLILMLQFNPDIEWFWMPAERDCCSLTICERKSLRQNADENVENKNPLSGLNISTLSHTSKVLKVKRQSSLQKVSSLPSKNMTVLTKSNMQSPGGDCHEDKKMLGKTISSSACKSSSVAFSAEETTESKAAGNKAKVRRSRVTRCYICFEEFSTSAKAKKHIESVHKDFKFVGCSFCSKKFSTMTRLFAHEDFCKKKQSASVKKAANKIMSKAIYTKHLSVQLKRLNTSKCTSFPRANEKAVKISTSGVKQASSSSEKKTCMKQKYQGQRAVLKEAMRLKCPSCDKFFQSETLYNKHVNLHSTKKNLRSKKQTK